MNALTQEDVLQMRLKSSENIQEFPKLLNISYDDFFKTYLLPNAPCLLCAEFTKSWKSRQDWCKEDYTPNFEFLKQKFGSVSVPVANCKKREDGSHPKLQMTMEEYLDYWEEYRKGGYPDSMDCLYLKDFHFNREFPDYEANKTPDFFSSDWMNEFWDQREDVNDDYRFVYMGPKGSWTPFHADVFRSYSWSANICGKKKWIFFPPGEEECLKDIHGQLVFDVDSDVLKDPSKFPKYKSDIRRIEVIQSAGEIIFVPSGWHHQVYNMEDTISINHNWLNGCNVDISWYYIKHGLAEVEKAIIDEKEGMIKDKEWYKHCQVMLKADKGINYLDFFHFMQTILNPRITRIKLLLNLSSPKNAMPLLSEGSSIIDKLLPTSHWSKSEYILFDVQRVKLVLEDMQRSPEFLEYDCEMKSTVINDIAALVKEIELIMKQIA